MGNCVQPAQQQQQQQQSSWYQKGAIPLGSCIGGIPIYLHWSFFGLLAIMILSTLISNSTDAKYWALIILMYGPILLLTIIIVSFFCSHANSGHGLQAANRENFPFWSPFSSFLLLTFLLCCLLETPARVWPCLYDKIYG